MIVFSCLIAFIILVCQIYIDNSIGITLTLLFLKIFNVLEIDLMICFVPILISAILYLLYLLLFPKSLKDKISEGKHDILDDNE